MSFTSGSSVPRTGGRQADLLSALNAAAAAIQSSARSEKDVLLAVERELAALGLSGGLVLLDSDRHQLEVRAAWLPGQALGVARAAAGERSHAALSALAHIPGYEAFVTRGGTAFLDSGLPLIDRFLALATPSLPSFTGRLAQAAPALLAAVRSEGGVRGALAIVDEALTPTDTGAVEAFANHLAVALDNARLVAELRAVNERLAAELVEHERAEAALRKSEAQFRGAFDNIAVGVMLVGIDGRILRPNTTLVDMLGYRPDELTTKTFNDITHPEDVGIGVSFLGRLLAGEITHARIEKRYLHRKGQVVWVVVSPSLLRDERGEPLGIVTLVQDITEQRRAEGALRRREREARVLLDATEELVLLIEPDGTLLAANQQLERRFGVGVEESVGKNLFELMPEEVSVTRRAAVERCRSSLKPVTFRDERAERVFDNRMVPIFDEQGEVAELAVFARDVTAELEAESARLEMDGRMRDAQKNESLALLASGVAHDFNNLLVGILGNIELALPAIGATHEARHNLDAVRVAADRAADLCKQMLAYSGRGKLVTEVVDISEVIDDMRQLLTASCARPGVLRYDLGADLPGIRGDTTQLRQVIMNLVTNAAEALGPAGGSILVRTGSMDCQPEHFRHTWPKGGHALGPYVYVEVEDTGCGMDPGTVGRMFDPFFSTKFAGRGLGLAALLGIVRAHDGAVTVVSEPGEGTRVRVLLPAQSARAPEKPAPGQRLESWRGSGTILVVDDEPVVRRVAAALLAKLGFEVVVASDGPEALAIFSRRGGEIACVLLDYTMPSMSGAEVMARLREQRPDIPVVLSSGFGNDGLPDELTDGHRVELLAKPYKLPELVAVLRRALDS